jgi:hypothetical protein
MPLRRAYARGVGLVHRKRAVGWPPLRLAPARARRGTTSAPGPRRQFALLGPNGQRICIDPPSRLVMIQAALAEGRESWRLWSALVDQLA